MRFYMIAVCRGSALDGATNNFTLFSLVEAVQLVTFEPRSPIPLEAHVYMEHTPEEINTPLELRAVWRGMNGERPITIGDPNPFTPTTVRSRIRAEFVQLPETLGFFHLTFQWRRAGAAEWIDDPAFWPLDFSVRGESMAPGHAEPGAKP
jgi:hypothetical protein